MIVQDLTPFTDDEAQAARASNFGFVCSMCVKLHAGRRLARATWDKAVCVGKRCWGPIGDKMYPEYEGPLKGSLSRFCWRCGEENPEITLAPPNGSLVAGELLGCCPEHAKLLKENTFERRDAGTEAKRKVRIAGHVVDW
jgi:hypothetical protein